MVEAQAVNQLNSVAFSYYDDKQLEYAGQLHLERNPEHGLMDGTTLGVVTDDFRRNDSGEVTGYTASSGMTNVLSIGYERDALGRIKHKTESIQGGPPVESFYKYDPTGRLWKVCADDACTTERAVYEYDSNSNRDGGFDPVHGTIAATYDEQDRLLSTTFGSQPTTYTYSDNGELETKVDATGTTTYDYDVLGNLRHIELPDGTEIDYIIDGRNRRVAKKFNGNVVRAFLYEDQLRPVAELNGAGGVVSRFVYADKVNVPEYMVKGGVTYRIVTDHLGSPRLVINTTTGAIAQSMTYDEWGNVLTDTNPGFQPFGFAGGLYDPDTGLVRFGARDYDARVGRWTAKDPIGFAAHDTSLYNYVFSDPVNGFDPTGESSASYAKILLQLALAVARHPLAQVFTANVVSGYCAGPWLGATGSIANTAVGYYVPQYIGWISTQALLRVGAILQVVISCHAQLGL